MTASDPFTLDLFGTSSLGTTLDFGLHLETRPRSNLFPDDETDDSPGSGDAKARPALAEVSNYYLDGHRGLAKDWRRRARENLNAIRLALTIEKEARSATREEQAALVKFVGFGASELANTCFRRPGEAEFPKNWTEIGGELETAVSEAEYASLARCTQYAHYTPEFIIRAIWRGITKLGFRGGRILEPGCGIGLFLSLMPERFRELAHVTGVELDPTSARIARLLHPGATIADKDFAQLTLPQTFDLAIGNPPFSDRIVRSDPALRALALRLHDFFIVKALRTLKPGAVAAFVTSHGTMDKADARAREQIAGMADLVAAIRLPEGSFRASAGTDVVADVLFFYKRPETEERVAQLWLDTAEVRPTSEDGGAIRVNRYFAENPEMVLGVHDLTRGIHGPDETYTCRALAGEDLEQKLRSAVERLPDGLYSATPEILGHAPDDREKMRVGRAAEGSVVREGSYFVGAGTTLMQIVDGRPVPVEVKKGRGADGVFAKHARILRKLIPVRDAVREVLRTQERDEPWKGAQVRLRIAWSSFTREFGPINFTSVSTTTDEETGEVREIHRRPNLQPFLDDPDCWLVASIEDYDLETNTARPGPIFSERVIAPPAPPVITSAADALAVVLSERGHVDLEHIAELLHHDVDDVLAELGEAVFRNPADGAWQTADAYLSGSVRTALATAEAGAALDPAYARNVAALRRVQPANLKPSDITARLGAPWIPVVDIEAFAREVLDTETTIRHTPEIASWNVDHWPFAGTVAGTSDWGTHRRDAGLLLSDALNSSIPQIFDTIKEGESERRILNSEATEAAKEKLARIKTSFQSWIWTDADRTDRLARVYNDRFNNLVPRHFDGSHLQLPGASGAFTLYAHQKRAIWRIVSAGSTYIAHAVGAGKTLSIAAAIMEQKRLGLIAKAMLVVPGHCLAQAAREFLALYPNARILVADETNFVREKRARFLSRAATATWDAIIITHSAFRFIAVPSAFEEAMIEAELDAFEQLIERVRREDRLSRKKVERMKEGHQARLEALASRKDDLLTIAELGVDQIILDEAQEFRKLSFATNMTSLRGVDPNGSQRAWDLYVKARFLETKNPGRALVLASGTPITNTLGEMFTVQRFLGAGALADRGLAEFDAWASSFGDTRTELELQPSGKYRPVTRFSEFVNVPELIAMFRAFADVVQPADLRDDVKVPAVAGGKRQIVTAQQSPAFKAYQASLDQRIKAIEQRNRPPEPGDDILLSVITDGRHAAIDLRLVIPDHEDEPRNKLNALVRNSHRIWQETAERIYWRKDGRAFERPGGGQLIFSDLGTIAVEASRGFSAYRWIRDELVRLGVPASEIAFMQDFRKSEAKQRLFSDFNAGKVRVLIGSSETMGTGVNVQARLKALHHLDVPWLPSQIEQREGRIVRQGNQHDEVELYAYATLGSLDATMWQNNERKARFIAAALSGDASVRRLEDVGEGQASQFAMAKAIASGDPRLMQKAGLEAEIARLERLRAAHVDDQHAVRRQIRDAQGEIAFTERHITEVMEDIRRHVPTRAEAFRMTVGGSTFTERKRAGQALMLAIMSMVQERRGGPETVAEIGGFPVSFHGRNLGRDGYGYDVTLDRTGSGHDVDLPIATPPLRAVARLEHMLANLDGELATYRGRMDDARRRLAGYEPRLGEVFSFAADLDMKRAELLTIEHDLAATADQKGRDDVADPEVRPDEARQAA